MKKLLLFSATLYLSFLTNAQTLVAYYPFNGNANDSIGSLNGTVHGATLTADRFGNPNSAYSFNGVDNFIVTSTVATTKTDNWTMTAWVKPASINQIGVIVCNGFDNGITGNGYAMIMNDGIYDHSGRFFSGLFSGLFFASSQAPFVTKNSWYYVAMVRDAGVTKFYINGVQTPGIINGSAPFVPSGTLHIGSQDGLRFWNGSIDEVKIYNVALTAKQIKKECDLPEISISNRTMKEGNSNTTNMSFFILLSHASDSAITVRCITKDKTATAGSDYISKSNVITINPGDTLQKVTIKILGDTTVEPDEDFYVILNLPVNATLGKDTAIGTIKNDDTSFAAIARTNNIKNNFTIELSPNPVQNILTVKGIKENAGYINISNLHGDIKLKQKVNSSVIEIDVSTLPQGIYILRYINDTDQQVLKFIKE